MKIKQMVSLGCICFTCLITELAIAQTSTYTSAEEDYSKTSSKKLPGGGKTITLPHADDCPTCPTEPVPFDGGIAVVLAAGVGYGIKKARDRRKEKKQTSAL